MPSEEVDGVVISSFPNASTIENNDVVTGLHNGNNANFLFSGIAAYIRQGLSNIFVPWLRIGTPNGVASLDSTGKVPSTQLPPISSDASDITYDPTTSGLSATNVQDAVDEMQGEIDNLPSPPAPSDANPQDLGTAAAVSSADYSRADHVHKKPTAADINAQPTITANGILKGDGAGGVSAATAGTDYQTPLTAETDYATPAQLADKAAKADLTNIQATGTTNTTGAAIPAGAYFYLNGVFYRATTQIDQNATFTVNTNCEQTTVGDRLVHSMPYSGTSGNFGECLNAVPVGKTLIAVNIERVNGVVTNNHAYGLYGSDRQTRSFYVFKMTDGSRVTNASITATLYFV